MPPGLPQFEIEAPRSRRPLDRSPSLSLPYPGIRSHVAGRRGPAVPDHGPQSPGRDHPPEWVIGGRLGRRSPSSAPP